MLLFSLLLLSFSPPSQQLGDFGCFGALSFISPRSTSYRENFKGVTSPFTPFCRPKSISLRDYLVRAKLRPLDRNTNGTRGTHKSTSNRCDVCNYIIAGDSFSSHVTSTSYIINHRLDCNFRDVVYLISCQRSVVCNVGSTATKFRLRSRALIGCL